MSSSATLGSLTFLSVPGGSTWKAWVHLTLLISQRDRVSKGPKQKSLLALIWGPGTVIGRPEKVADLQRCSVPLFVTRQ